MGELQRRRKNDDQNHEQWPIQCHGNACAKREEIVANQSTEKVPREMSLTDVGFSPYRRRTDGAGIAPSAKCFIENALLFGVSWLVVVDDSSEGPASICVGVGLPWKSLRNWLQINRVLVATVSRNNDIVGCVIPTVDGVLYPPDGRIIPFSNEFGIVAHADPTTSSTIYKNCFSFTFHGIINVHRQNIIDAIVIHIEIWRQMRFSPKIDYLLDVVLFDLGIGHLQDIAIAAARNLVEEPYRDS